MVGIKWSKEEVEYLKANFRKESGEQVSKALFAINGGHLRRESAIEIKYYRLNLKDSNPTKFWSEEEIEYLKANYADSSAKKVSKALFELNGGIERSPRSVRTKASALQLSSNFSWQPKETEYLLELAEQYPLEELYKKYRSWAVENNLKVRSQLSLVQYLRTQGRSTRILGSNEYLSCSDLQLFFGCSRGTVTKLLNNYSDELRPKRDGTGRAVAKSKFKKFLLENQSILIKYQSKLDICWLADLLGGKF